MENIEKCGINNKINKSNIFYSL